MQTLLRRGRSWDIHRGPGNIIFMDLLNVAWVIFMCHGINSLEEESIMECFKYVSGKYFNDRMILLLVSDEGNGKESGWLYEMVKYVIGSEKWSVHLSDENYRPPGFHYFHLKLDRQRAGNILILMAEETPDASDKITELARNWLWHSSARIMIVWRGEGNGEQVLVNLWQKKRALNVVVMAIGRESIRFSTMRPFPNSNRTVTVNVWTNRFPEERDLYADKIPKDMERHLVKMGLYHDEPYVLKPEVPGVYTDGLEIRIVNALRDHLNFELEFMEAPEGENPFIAMVNGTPSGLFGLLHRGIADMIFLGLKDRFDRHALSDPLTPHWYDRSVWIVPSSSSERGSFYNVFEVEVWIATAFTFVFLTCLLVLLNRFKRESDASSVPSLLDCIMLILCCQLNYPASVSTQNTRVKVFMVAMYLYALHITSAYDSNLVQMFTGRAVQNFFDSPNKAAEAGLVAYLYPSARPVYNQSNHEMWNKILQPSGHVFTNDYIHILTVLSKNKTGFTLMLENVAKYEIAKRNGPKEQTVHIIDKAFSSYPISFFMARGHPFVELFNRKVQQLVESGIIFLWMKQFLLGYRQMRRGEFSFNEEEPLKLKHFRVLLLYLVLGGWAIATFAFIFELLVGKLTRQKAKRDETRYRSRWDEAG